MVRTVICIGVNLKYKRGRPKWRKGLGGNFFVCEVQKPLLYGWSLAFFQAQTQWQEWFQSTDVLGLSFVSRAMLADVCFTFLTSAFITLAFESSFWCKFPGSRWYKKTSMAGSLLSLSQELREEELKRWLGWTAWPPFLLLMSRGCVVLRTVLSGQRPHVAGCMCGLAE